MTARPRPVRRATAALLALLAATATAAQEQRSSPTSREEAAAPGGPEAAMTHVGAGTTDGSTTGYSGPEGDGEASSGEVSLPPLPSADACEPYQDTAAYDACLSVVLRDEPEEEAQ
jgi:hypothetical protein